MPWYNGLSPCGAQQPQDRLEGGVVALMKIITVIMSRIIRTRTAVEQYRTDVSLNAVFISLVIGKTASQTNGISMGEESG